MEGKKSGSGGETEGWMVGTEPVKLRALGSRKQQVERDTAQVLYSVLW